MITADSKHYTQQQAVLFRYWHEPRTSHLHKNPHCLLGPTINMDNLNKMLNPLNLFIGLRSHSKIA